MIRHVPGEGFTTQPEITGVDNVVSGYPGGDATAAHYEMVSTGKTGHVETVKITYNPRTANY